MKVKLTHYWKYPIEYFPIVHFSFQEMDPDWEADYRYVISVGFIGFCIQLHLSRNVRIN